MKLQIHHCFFFHPLACCYDGAHLCEAVVVKFSLVCVCSTSLYLHKNNTAGNILQYYHTGRPVTTSSTTRVGIDQGIQMKNSEEHQLVLLQKCTILTRKDTYMLFKVSLTSINTAILHFCHNSLGVKGVKQNLHSPLGGYGRVRFITHQGGLSPLQQEVRLRLINIFIVMIRKISTKFTTL